MIYASSRCEKALGYCAAFATIEKSAGETLWGRPAMGRFEAYVDRIDVGHMQGVLDLHRSNPGTRVHLHIGYELNLANLHHGSNDVAMEQIIEVSRSIGADVISMRPGFTRHLSLDDLIDRARMISGHAGIPVLIEGMYPARGSEIHLGSWSEYQALLESGVGYSLNMAHIDILTAQDGLEPALLERLAAGAALIRVSGTDGSTPSRMMLTEAPWWMPFLKEAKAPVFTDADWHDVYAPRAIDAIDILEDESRLRMAI